MRFWFDLRYALWLLLKKPGFTAMTIGVMACGLGICIFMFTFIYNTMFKPLDFDNGERMVVIDRVVNNVISNGGNVKYSLYSDIKAQNNSFEIFGAMQHDTLNVSGGDTASSQPGVWTEASMFTLTKAKALKGRVFNQADDTVGAPRVAVIGYDLWHSYFAAREDIIGHRFYINGYHTEIIGVMPQGYLFPRSTQIWLPIQLDHGNYPRSKGPRVGIFALLKPGVTIDEANTEMTQIVDRVNVQYPQFNNGESLQANTFMVSMMGNSVIPVMIIMLIAVGFVLLLACINVANLLFARSTERAKETAIRVALGAPQSRLVMQMLWESLIICTIGGVFALLMAAYGIELTNQIMPTFLEIRPPFWWHIELDASVMMLTFSLIVLTSLITGILPARRIIKGDFNAVLRDGTRGAQSKRAKRFSQALVVLEVTLSAALLTAAAVMSYAVDHAINADYGADISNQLSAKLSLPSQSYNSIELRIQYYQTLQTSLQNTAGIESVAIMSSLPAQNSSFRPVIVEGAEQTNKHNARYANRVAVMPGSLKTLKYQLKQGRFFADSDNLQSEKVAIVTESFAQQHWPQVTSVLGRKLQWTDRGQTDWYTVIGVVNNAVHGQPFSDFKHRPSVYLSNLQMGYSYMAVAVKTLGDANALRKPLIKAIDSVDGLVPPFRVKTMQQVTARNTAGIEFIVSLFSIFGFCATVLAATGIYALMSNAIVQRTQELGVRRALGAPDEKIVSMLMKQGGVQLLIGMVFGLPIAYLFSNLIIGLVGINASQIYWLFIAIPLFIAVIVLIATYVPTKRAISLTPNVALRYE